MFAGPFTDPSSINKDPSNDPILDENGEEVECFVGARDEWFPEPEPFEDFGFLDGIQKALPKPPSLLPSRFTEFAFRMPRVDGFGYENFSFDGRRHMTRPYDTPAKRMLLICARQCEKSTLLGNIALCYSCMIPAYKTLYVSPSSTQTKTFSTDRIKEPIETSEVLRAYTTSMLSQNVFEKQFSNRSKITLRYAFLNADRCAIGSTRVHFSGGAVASLQSIYETPELYIGRKVLAADPTTLAIALCTLTDVVDQGVRSVFQVTLEGGAEVVCTSNEPFLTWNGWVPLAGLSEGSFVGVPNQTPHGSGNDIPIEEYRVIGYLLGDGCLTTFAGVAFFSGIPAVMTEFQRCAKGIGAVLGRLTNNKKKWVHSNTKRQGLYGGPNGYKKRLRTFGLIGKSHSTKRVPEVLFGGNKEQIINLLGAIYATDGWASVSTTKQGVQYEIGYASNSKGLCQDLKTLLLRFGIRAILSKQKKPSTPGARGAFTLSIRSAEDVKLFCSTIPVIGKEDEFSIVQRAAERIARLKDDYDRIPFTYQQLRTYLYAQYGLTTHSAWQLHRIQLRPGNVKDSIGRRVLRTIASKLEDSYLKKISMSPIGWARISNITQLPPEQTYDLTINILENYLVDGAFLHNTRGIPAHMLEIDELQDILNENIPVIEQCTSHAPDKLKRFIYSGTPKSLDNTIEYYRSARSTQGEWVIPCDKHGGETGRHWNVLGEKNISKKGLACEKCGSLIDLMHPDAQWARMVQKATFESYRIPQLMVPWKPWDEILLDYDRYPRDKFYNEVLGISYDSGTRPLTSIQLQECCDPTATMQRDRLTKYRRLGYAYPIYAGIDWGCHDDKTRVLTNTGFKLFKELQKNDKVAQWDPVTRQMSFVVPNALIAKEWDSPLHHYTGKGVDLMVTHTHKMRVRTPERNWQIENSAATVLRKSDFQFTGYVKWEGQEMPHFILPKQNKSPGYSGAEEKIVFMDDWLEWLGYYLSEGGLCLTKKKNGDVRPYCVKMSQRETVNPDTAHKIADVLTRLPFDYTAFPNPKTGDINWTIYGKQVWDWLWKNVGLHGHEKRIPREVFQLSTRQLQILFDALIAGDGSVDIREGTDSGGYYSTSKGLCEDVQELCIRLGLKATLSLQAKASGNRKTRWRVSWSRGRDMHIDPHKTEIVPYKGQVYCCSVPTGFIVTERNGRISYQGNSGSQAYTVISLGMYDGLKFRIFYVHRFVGEDIDPEVQIERIKEIIDDFNVTVVGCDWGFGFGMNDRLIRQYGRTRVYKYHYMARCKKKVEWDGKLSRFKVHRTEVMSDLFNAIKRKQFIFPRWEEFRTPYGQDMLNIFSEESEALHQIQYTHSPDNPDDTFHSILYCLLASMLKQPRPDIITPNREDPKKGGVISTYSGPVDQG